MNPGEIIIERKNKTVYRDGNRCCKVFNEQYSKADILGEALNQARLEETGLSVPRLLEVTVLDGKWAIVYEYVEGRTLAEMMREHPERMEEYMDHFVDLQLHVLSQTCPLLTPLRDKMTKKIAQSDLPATVRYSLHAALDTMPRHGKICHGDFRPSNVIIREDGSYCILDWARATRGNGSADAATSYLLFTIYWGEELAERYMETFCRKAGVERAYVEKWLPLVAAAHSVKGNEAEQAFMKKLLNVI